MRVIFKQINSRSDKKFSKFYLDARACKTLLHFKFNLSLANVIDVVRFNWKYAGVSCLHGNQKNTDLF